VALTGPATRRQRQQNFTPEIAKGPSGIAQAAAAYAQHRVHRMVRDSLTFREGEGTENLVLC